jgi:hypothetical protein
VVSALSSLIGKKMKKNKVKVTQRKKKKTMMNGDQDVVLVTRGKI